MSKETISAKDVGVVEAVALAVGSGMSGNATLAAKLDAAMQLAIVVAQADGVTDPQEMRERIMAARDQVLADEEPS